MTTRHVWVGGSDPGVMIVDVDPALQPGEVEIDTSDLSDAPPADGTGRGVAVSRTITPKMDNDALLQQLAIEHLIANRRPR